MKRIETELISDIKKCAKLYYLVPDLLKVKVSLWNQFMEDFTLKRQKIILTNIAAYDDLANWWISSYKDIVDNFEFPYIDPAVAAAFIRGYYDRIRKIHMVRGYTESYLQETDPKKQTEDHYLIPEFEASKQLLELIILHEEGRYDVESLLFHNMNLCNVIKCTTIENTKLKKNIDEDGLRHLEGYKKNSIRLFNGDQRVKRNMESRLIHFEDFPTNQGYFITDKYPKLKYYTNRMFVADYSELKRLGRPKIKK